MCLPPDVSTPALPSIGRRRDVNPSQWSPDPRAYQNWGASPTQSTGGGGGGWTPYYNMDYYNMPQSGFAKEDACGTNVIEAAPLGSLLASALEASHKWQPQPNWAAPQSNSFYCSPPQAMHSSYGGGMDGGAALMQSACGDTEGVPAGQETLSSITHCALESREEENLQAGSLFDELYQDGRLEEEAAANKFCQPASKVGKTAAHKTKHAVRNGVKKESKAVDVGTGESDLDGSDEEGEGGAPVISEKRRKRMLSNRASAQRSRQRRQERLDTLEVLVAQLRVENAALKTKASSAAASVKKLEDENRVLRERLDAKELNREHQGSSGEKDDDQSFRTTGGKRDVSDLGDSPERVTISVKTRSGDSDSSSENSDPNKSGDAAVGTNNVTSSMNAGNSYRNPNQQGSKTKKRSGDGTLRKEWSFNPNYTTVFGTEEGETVENSTCKTANGKITSRMGGPYLDCVQEYEPLKNLVGMNQFSGLSQEMDAFDLDLEHSPDVDKKLLESVEEIWMDGFSDVCFK